MKALDNHESAYARLIAKAIAVFNQNDSFRGLPPPLEKAVSCSQVR